MKIRVWYCMIDCGDGSMEFEVFPSEKEALVKETEEFELMGYGVPDAVSWQDIDIDNFEEIK